MNEVKKDIQILSEFSSLLRQAGETRGFRCQLWLGGTRRKSRHLVELSGSINCLVYIHVSSKKTYHWGVTANRIEEFRQSGKGWIIVLLYETPETGYFLTSNDVNRYLSIWALARDGDYKVQPGSYLQFNKPFNSFSEFIDSLLG
jgi:hypothetical protein